MKFDALLMRTDRKIGLFLFFTTLIIATASYLWQLNALPLTDYDEATYAQVTRDTLASGDFLTLKRFSEPWFEKPPLYFWLAMGSTSMFGTGEWAYRLPSALFAILGIAVLWLLVNRLTNNARTATLASLVLLTVPLYFVSARQVRLDIPVITMILVSLLVFVYGWTRKRALVLVAPAIAVGFLLKSFVVFVAVPVIVIFSICYRKYAWLKSPFLWIGVLLGFTILLPWHWYEASRWGSAFFDAYLGQHVFTRFTAGISRGIPNLLAFFTARWVYTLPWIVVFVFVIPYLVWRYARAPKEQRQPLGLASILSALVIFLVFAASKTKILTYFLPLFPFAAIAIAYAFVDVYRYFKKRWLKTGVLLALSFLFGFAIWHTAGFNPKTVHYMHPPYTAMEKQVGELIASYPKPSHLYVIEWASHETLRYYSRTDVSQLAFPPAPGTLLQAPWFLMFTNLHISYFAHPDGSIKDRFKDLELKYADGQVFLLFGDKDFEL